MKKKVLSLFLALVLVVSLMLPAAVAAKDDATEAAETLHALGLFNGTGTDANGNPNFDLDRAPTRYEAVTMLVRLLGKDGEAKAGTWKTPFTDVVDWAKPYVGFAYANGLTAGTSATTFGGGATVSASQYLTFVLRALGYDSSVDFKWDAAWELSDKIGLTNGEYNKNTTEFLRADLAIISNNALDVRLKGSRTMLLRKIYSQLLAESWEEEARKRPLASFNIPKEIGTATLTYEDARALIGQDPDVIAEKVKTVGDAVQYMIAARFSYTNKPAFTPWYYGVGFDAPGREQVLQNYGCCCGGYANLALFLLKGDYEEMGIVRWLGGGNHTINYLLKDGKYYVFDLTEYSWIGNYNNKNAPVTVLDDLKDYYDNLPDIYPNRGIPKSEIRCVIALRVDDDAHDPYGIANNEYTMVYPPEARDRITVIYQQTNYPAVTYEPITKPIPMWNTEELDIPALNVHYDTLESLKQDILDLKK